MLPRFWRGCRTRRYQGRRLRSIVEALQIAHVPQAEWPAKALEAIEGLLAKQHEPVVPSNEGADVDAMIRQARDAAPDVERAVGILREGRVHLREERLMRQRAEAALLKEEAEFLSLTYRHTEAIEALAEAIRLDRTIRGCASSAAIFTF